MKRTITIEDKENNIYYQINPQYFDEILYLAQNYPNHCATMIKCKGTKRHPERNREHLMSWINDCLPLLQNSFYTVSTKVYWILHGLIDFPVCAYCHSNKRRIMKNVTITEGYTQYCCYSCGIKHAIEYDNIIERRQQTINEKYGKDKLAIRAKMSQTKQAFSCEKKKQIQEKRIQTTRLHYGYDHIFQVPEIIENIKQTHLRNLGVENPAQSLIIKQKTCIAYK